MAKAHECVKCSQCDAHFHRSCLDPMREDWSDAEAFLCNECCENCVVCGNDDETDENPILICDNCDEWFHLACLDEEDRPPDEEIGDEEVEWYCAECYDEYESDMEWADEHMVAEDEMTADECFTRSTCECDVCRQCNHAVDTWREFEPTNPIQASLKNAIDTRGQLLMQIMDDVHFRHNKPPPRA